MRVKNAADLYNAMAIAKAGEEIVLADGQYDADPSRGPFAPKLPGQPSKPVRVRAEHPRQAVVISNGAESAFKITQPYWWIEDLVVRANRTSTYAIKLEGDAQGGRIAHCTIEVGPSSECGVKGAGGSKIPQPDRVTVEGCTILMPTPTTYAMAEGVDAVAVNGWVVSKCRIEGFKTAARGVAFGVVIKGNSKNARIMDNVIFDCFIGASLGGGGTGKEWMRDGDTTFETRTGTIEGNVISNSNDVAIYLYSANGTRVAKNSCFKSYTNLEEGGSSIDVRMPGSTAVISLNILDKPIKNRDGGVHTTSCNLFLPASILGNTIFFPL